jgi:hypothetical protein
MRPAPQRGDACSVQRSRTRQGSVVEPPNRDTVENSKPTARISCFLARSPTSVDTLEWTPRRRGLRDSLRDAFARKRRWSNEPLALGSQEQPIVRAR